MARKSAELRLSQVRTLIEGYDNAGLVSDRSYRFMQDMAVRLDRGKGLSKGQRNYLDSLIEQGVPKPKNETRVNEILAAAEVDGMQGKAGTLKDFAYKVGKGWSLSEKQEKFLAGLLAKAEKLKVEGRFRPDGSLLEDLEIAVEICAKKNGWYWNHRPGTARAFDKVETWVSWNRRNKVRSDLLAAGIDEAVVDGGHCVGEEPIIDQWACDKLLKAVKNPLEELKNPKHPEGSMVWKIAFKGPRVCALVVGPPDVKEGKIYYPCLIDGSDVMVAGEDLRKRRA